MWDGGIAIECVNFDKLKTVLSAPALSQYILRDSLWHK